MSEALTPTEPVEIDLGDGVIRHLRYTLGSMRRLKKKFGTSMLSPEALSALDEDKLADLIYEGLAERNGLTIEDMAEAIDTRRLKQILEAFSAAFSGAMPEKNAPTQTPAVQ